jgi:PEP-CTERM motif
MRAYIAAALTFLGSTPAVAVPILESSFGPQAITETFDSLASVSGTPAGPLVLSGNTYTTSSGFYRVLGPASGGSPECLLGVGTCISTGLEDIEYLDIVLGTASVRAGLWVGGWTFTEGFALSNVNVSFFSVTDELLGTVNFSGPRMGFVGWESLPEHSRIGRIRVEDLALNSRVVAIDNLTWDPRPVPEPSTAALFCFGLALCWLGRRVMTSVAEAT